MTTARTKRNAFRALLLQAKLTAPYDGLVPGGAVPLPGGIGTSADRFISAMYTEMTAAGQ
jgi:cyclase